MTGTEPVEHTIFDWRIYAEATCAGLTPLVPIPFVDLAIEAIFRWRMPGTISTTRKLPLAPRAGAALSRGTGTLVSVEGCLKIPFAVLRYVLRRIWRKLIYVFAIADAAKLTSEYWHRAYLLDHLIRAGHAGPGVDWPRSVEVFAEVLRNTDVSPLTSLARQTVSSSHRVATMLLRARRRGAATETESLSDILRSNWDAAESALMESAVRYNEAYARSLARRPPPPPRQVARDDA
ncbi:MAG: hypothetical protein V2I67_20170 [Thermoanaerobaculales bacterium]|jgi:hypothetical protein|nr:hypothetical protein [Thermoanaerobaculales bacterium]